MNQKLLETGLILRLIPFSNDRSGVLPDISADLEPPPNTSAFSVTLTASNAGSDNDEITEVWKDTPAHVIKPNVVLIDALKYNHQNLLELNYAEGRLTEYSLI